MPETLDYLLTELEAIEYFGYHRVGENTFPNLIPILTGKHVKEIELDCWPNTTSKFDNCSFIWEKFNKKGYATVHAEEESWMGTFNYGIKTGFKKQPTTYYWMPFSLEIGRNLGKYHSNTKPCLNERPAPEYLLNYTMKFIRSYKKSGLNFFGLFWECSITHDLYKFYPEYDPMHRDFLKDIHATGILNNTILFFMSDHGYRYGEFLEYYKGNFILSISP